MEKKEDVIGFPVVFKKYSYQPSSNSPTYILEDIDISISPGEFVSVVGSNAAGKSTLLKAIAGELIKDNITGEVLVNGQIINKPVNRIIDRVGIVHQFDHIDLIDSLSVVQNIALRKLLGSGNRFKLFPITSRWKRSIGAELNVHGVIDPPQLDNPVHTLAGGKKQMLNVAIAINFEHETNPCRLLILDEHTSRLDSNNAKRVMNYTLKEIKRSSITTLMVTHKLTDAIEFTDRIIVMKSGKVKTIIDQKNNGKISLLELTDLIEKESN